MKKIYSILLLGSIAMALENQLQAQTATINCPSNILVSANNIGCTGIVSYALPTATTPIIDTLTHSVSNSFGTGATRCDDGVSYHYDNGYYRVYNLTALGYTGTVDIDSIQFGVSSTTVSSDTQVVFARIYKYSGTLFIQSEFTLLVETPVILNNTLTNVFRSGYAGITVQATDTILVELFTPSGISASNSFIMGSNNAGQTDFSYLSTGFCAIPDPLDYNAIDPTVNLLLNLIITTQTSIPTYLYNGLASGSVFSLGTTTNTYYASPAPGDSSFCSFNVTVTNPVTIDMSGLSANICADEGLYLLTGATPAGGNYFGANITANSFDTDTASLGVNTINYTFTNANGCNDSASTTVNVNSCVDIEQNEAFGFNVYPNPATNYININISGANQVTANINDLSGRMIVSKLLTGGNSSLSLTELKPGIYLVILTDKESGKQITKKIIKL